MKFVLPTIALALAVFATGCVGYVTVDGYDATYAEAPRGYERAPRHEYRGTYVYEINGRYYRQYNRRWVVYRERPRDLRHDRR